MRALTTTARRLSTSGGVLAATGLLLLTSACGGSSGGSASGGSSAAPKSSTPAVQAKTVGVGKTSAGTVLVDAQGMTLYAFAADSKGHSACTGTCATYWPPVTGVASASHAAQVAAKIGSIKRSDGSRQLTINGFPMYTYAGDSGPGQASGQGKNLSGGLWWVVAPSGSWIKTSGGSSSSSSGGGY
jgi:predicted lipoprotein with Yx(FWY)xxD motif